MGERRYLAIRFLDRLTISSTNLFAYRAEDLLPDSSCIQELLLLPFGTRQQCHPVFLALDLQFGIHAFERRMG